MSLINSLRRDRFDTRRNALGEDRLLLIPRRLETTQGVFAAYLLDRQLPWAP
jgi:hypothetical protein